MPANVSFAAYLRHLAALELQFSSSPAYLLLCALLAAGLTALLYWRRVPDTAPWLTWALRGLRFTALFILLVLFLEPLWTAISEERQPPIVAVVVDDSESMTAHADSLFVRNELLGRLESLREEVQNAEGRVQNFRFSNALAADNKASFQGTGTDLSTALRTLRDRFANQNLAGVVLVSDGIATAGANPAYLADELPFPVFTALVGDTTPRTDLAIAAVLHNELSHVNAQAPVQVKLRATALPAGSVTVRITENGTEVARQVVQLPAGRLTEAETTLYLTLKTGGLKAFAVHVDERPGERTYRNNHRVFYLNVLETKLNVNLLAGGPHPDLAAFYQVFGRDTRYTYKPFVRRDENQLYVAPSATDIAQTDLFILHDFPASVNDRPLMEQIDAAVENRNAAVVLVVGPRLKWSLIPQRLQERLAVRPNRYQTTTDEATPVLAPGYKSHPSFRFPDAGAFAAWLQSAPPLLRNASSWALQPNAQALATSQIKSIALDYPLLALRDADGRKNLVVLGPNLWRWRVHAFTETGTFDYFDTWWHDLAEWLTVQADKRRFKVYPTQWLFSNDAPALLKGEVYDETYRSIPDADVRVRLTGPDDQTTQYVLREAAPGAYQLALPNLAEGVYRYTAVGTKESKQLGTDAGEFRVGRPTVEFADLQARADVLQQLAARTEGAYQPAKNLPVLTQAILESPTLAPLVSQRRRTTGLHELLWPILLVLGCLSAEWVLRKRNGLL